MPPSPAPSPPPTPVPSPDCGAGTHLYSWRLYDAGGDGWQGATYRVYADAGLTYVLQSGTLADGAGGRDFYCLPDSCGWLAVGGGAADSEVSYTLDSFDASPMTSFEAGAPSTNYFCLSAGSIAFVPTPAPTTSAAPTAAPTPAPSSPPTASPTAPPSAAPRAAPSAASTTAPPTPAPTPTPTPAPTRTPITAVSVGVSGIACADFNATVFELALDSLVSNATFSDAACDDVGAGAVAVDNEVTVPLATAARAGHGSAHAYVTDALEAAVSDGSFTAAIVHFATLLGARRLSMASASVDSVSVSTFAPTPAPTPPPTPPPTAADARDADARAVDAVAPTGVPSAAPCDRATAPASPRRRARPSRARAQLRFAFDSDTDRAGFGGATFACAEVLDSRASRARRAARGRRPRAVATLDATVRPGDAARARGRTAPRCDRTYCACWAKANATEANVSARGAGRARAAVVGPSTVGSCAGATLDGGGSSGSGGRGVAALVGRAARAGERRRRRRLGRRGRRERGRARRQPPAAVAAERRRCSRSAPRRSSRARTTR